MGPKVGFLQFLANFKYVTTYIVGKEVLEKLFDQ